MKTIYATAVFILLLGSSHVKAARLERPKSIVEVHVAPGETPREVLQRIAAAAQAADFEVSGDVRWSEGYFELVRKESKTIHHRTVVWIDWSLERPGSVLRVYLLYSRFQLFTGSAWKEVSVNEKEEIHATEDLRRSIQRRVGGF